MAHLWLDPCPADEAVLASELKLIGSCRDERDQQRIDGLRALCQQLGVQVGGVSVGPGLLSVLGPGLLLTPGLLSSPAVPQGLSRCHELWSMTVSAAEPGCPAGPAPGTRWSQRLLACWLQRAVLDSMSMQDLSR